MNSDEQQNQLFELAMEARTSMLKNKYNPIEALVDIAQHSEDQLLRFKCAKELSAFYAPRMGSLKQKEEAQADNKPLYIYMGDYKSEEAIENPHQTLQDKTQQFKHLGLNQ